MSPAWLPRTPSAAVGELAWSSRSPAAPGVFQGISAGCHCPPSESKATDTQSLTGGSPFWFRRGVRSLAPPRQGLPHKDTFLSSWDGIPGPFLLATGCLWVGVQGSGVRGRHRLESLGEERRHRKCQPEPTAASAAG